MGQNTREMLAKRRRTLLNHSAAAAMMAVSLLTAASAFGQPAPQAGTQGTAPPARRGPVSRPADQTGVASFADTLIPGFQLGATLDVNETYATNAGGTANTSRSDWITFGGLNLTLNDHSRRVSLDANYTGSVNYYAQTQPTLFSNELGAVANVIAIPDYLNFIGKAFAQPVVISNLGVTTANGGVARNGFRNSYGYSAGPDLTFRLGDFAGSETSATYGAAYYTNLSGSSGFSLIPGVAGPENTTTRNVTEKLSSGSDFSRLNWTIVGVWNELDRPQGLFSEKSGIGTLQYAITTEIAILGTGGYDALHNTLPLRRNVTGPVAMGGFSITFDDDFFFQIQAGQKYNSASYLGSLHWNIGPTTVLTGSATDTITTPEGQQLNNLSSLTSSLNGQITSGANIYSSGLASSLGSFNTQSTGSQSFNQQIARYQRIDFNFAEDLEREHFNVLLFGMRLTELDTFFAARPVTNSWGGDAFFTHDFTRQLSGTVGAGYANYQELGGNAGTITVNGQLAYSLSPDTRVYLRADYLRRDSSSALQQLSPFTGSLDDTRVSIGFSHTFLP